MKKEFTYFAGCDNRFTVPEEHLHELFNRCHDRPWDYDDAKPYYQWLVAHAKVGHIIVRNCKECAYGNMNIDENDIESEFEKFCVCLDCKENYDNTTYKELIS